MPSMASTYSYDLLSEENIKKYVLPYYNLENCSVERVKFKDTDKQRAVYKVLDTNKSYCLKKVYFNKENLLFVYSAIEWLYRHNVLVPRVLPTYNKSRFVNYNDMLFILTDWIEGRKCSYDNDSDTLLSALNLGKIHKCTINFKPIKGSTLRSEFEDITISTSKHFGDLLNCSNKAFRYKDNFSRLFLQNFHDNFLLAKTSLSVSNSINFNNLGTSLCHLDYVNKNIIFDKNNSIWVIDFDKCKIDYCVHDISYFLRRILKRDKTRWNLDLCIRCLNMYEKMRPLNLDEYKYILSYLSFPQKYWKISRDYYNNIRKCNKASFFTLLKKSVNKTEEHCKFVYEFAKYIEEKFQTTIN